MFNQSYEVYITPLVINSLGCGHTDTHTHTHTDTHRHTDTRMHTDNPHRNNFKKPGVSQPAAGAPGLKISPVFPGIHTAFYGFM